MDDWKQYLVAGFGGGAIEELTDQLIGQFFKGLGQIAGIELKDVIMVFLMKFAADKTSGLISTAFKGAGIIALYKLLYPQFIKPLLAGFGIKTGSPPDYHEKEAKPLTALDYAKAYVGMR
jgi:hypothetical protein